MTKRHAIYSRRWASGLGLAALVVLGALVPGEQLSGGTWHRGHLGLHCGDCHIMHASRRGVAYGGSLTNPTGFPRLLKAATTSELCLTCHDGGSGTAGTAPDVSGAASYETSTLKRSAGGFQAGVGVSSAQGHDLGVAGQVAPGGTWSSGTGMSCTTCHDPHGNGSYRNLVLRPGTASSDRPVTAVVEAVQTPPSTRYSAANIRYTSSTEGLAAWCQGCHTNAHGAPGSGTMGGAPGGDAPGSSSFWLRHPTQGVTLAQGVANGHVDPTFWFTTALSRVPVVSPSGTVPGTATGSDNEVFCGSCHKAHGSAHRFALIWDNGATSAHEDGTSSQQTCQACHYK